MEVESTPRRGKRHTSPVAPVVISQANCEAALGVPARKHLELVRTLRLPHRKIGSLVLVALNDYLDALRAPEPKPVETKPQAITIEDVRARLGLALG